jgi:anaerobic magnesium-protoporphyrin IX monomethyl ester cyclase
MTSCLLVYPNALRYPFVPIGFGTIAALAQDACDTVQLYDATFLDDREVLPAFLRAVEAASPDVVAAHCSSADWALLRCMLEHASAALAGVTVIVGGPHCTAVPSEVSASPHVDITVVGEAETAFRMLLDRLQRGAGVLDVPNCWVRGSSGVIENAPARLVEDLDSLPYPSWSLFDARHISFSREDEPSPWIEGAIESSRGCSGSCAYCVTDHVRRLYRGLGRFCREKSVERVVREAKDIRDMFSLDFLHLVDDNFVGSLTRLRELAEAFETEVRLPLFVQASADRINVDTAALLARLGAEYVGIGVEVGSETYRRDVLHKRVSNDQLVRAFDMLRDVGVKPWAYYMVGLPHQTRDDIVATVELDRRLRPAQAFVSTYYPFPGTMLFDRAREDGLLGIDEGAPDYFEGQLSLRLPDLSLSDIQRARDLFPHAYRRNTRAHGRSIRAVLEARGR